MPKATYNPETIKADIERVSEFRYISGNEFSRYHKSLDNVLALAAWVCIPNKETVTKDGKIDINWG